MTKKDFELIAGALRGVCTPASASIDYGRQRAAKAIADVLATTNPRFDRERFLTACGVQS